ncbi:MAG: DsbA family protein [Alphaproteobacteria bacterium]|jgi:protein-disulfide isomerase|nr:DsbA family protein [Alphaproteobacteria bacterium]
MIKNKILMSSVAIVCLIAVVYFTFNEPTENKEELILYTMNDVNDSGSQVIQQMDSNIIDVSLEELTLGDPNAPITIIEYASMTCSHCAEFHNKTYPDLKKNHIDTGEVKFIFREFPLDKLAMATSMLARCVDNEISMAFIEILFKNRDRWISENALNELKNFSKQAGLDSNEFDACLNNQQLLDDLIAGKEKAIEDYKINSTPSFIINGEVVSGNKPYSFFKSKIEEILAKYKGA